MSKYRITADVIVEAPDKETAASLFSGAVANGARLGGSDVADFVKHSPVVIQKLDANDETQPMLDIRGFVTGKDENGNRTYLDKPAPIELNLDPNQADAHGITPADREKLKGI